MGGGGSSSKSVPVQAPEIEPVPTANIPVAQGPAFGPTYTPNPYFAGNAPSWATGWFEMPWWGKDPLGNNLSQAQMQYQAPPPQAASPFGSNYASQAAPSSSWLDMYKAGVMNRGDAATMLRRTQGMSNLDAQRYLNNTIRHPMARVGEQVRNWD